MDKIDYIKMSAFTARIRTNGTDEEYTQDSMSWR